MPRTCCIERTETSTPAVQPGMAGEGGLEAQHLPRGVSVVVPALSHRYPHTGSPGAAPSLPQLPGQALEHLPPYKPPHALQI